MTQKSSKRTCSVNKRKTIQSNPSPPPPASKSVIEETEVADDESMNINNTTDNSTTSVIKRVVVRRLIPTDSESDEDSEGHSEAHVQKRQPSRTTSTRGKSPTETAMRSRVVKKSPATRKRALSITFDSSTDDNDEETRRYSTAPSPVWQYAVRSEDKSYATCRLCDKRISTSNWSTSSLRRHLIQMHNKSELMLSKKHKRNVTPDAPQRVREKFHKLSVEAIIKDSLPFNAFNKPGLSRLIEEAIPGKKNLLARNFTL